MTVPPFPVSKEKWPRRGSAPAHSKVLRPTRHGTQKLCDQEHSWVHIRFAVFQAYRSPQTFQTHFGRSCKESSQKIPKAVVPVQTVRQTPVGVSQQQCRELLFQDITQLLHQFLGAAQVLRLSRIRVWPTAGGRPHGPSFSARRSWPRTMHGACPNLARAQYNPGSISPAPAPRRPSHVPASLMNEYPSGGGVSDVHQIRQAGSTVSHHGNADLDHLHERNGPLLHPGATEPARNSNSQAISAIRRPAMRPSPVITASSSPVRVRARCRSVVRPDVRTNPGRARADLISRRSGGRTPANYCVAGDDCSSSSSQLRTLSLCCPRVGGD